MFDLDFSGYWNVFNLLQFDKKKYIKLSFINVN